MRIKDLIAELTRLDPNAIAVVAGHEGDWHEIRKATPGDLDSLNVSTENDHGSVVRTVMLTG